MGAIMALSRRALTVTARAHTQAFEEVVPNELLKLRVRLNEISIKVSAPTLPSAVVLVIGDARMRSDLMPDLPRSIFHADLDRTRVLAIAGEDDLQSGAKASNLSASEIGSAWRYWRVRSSPVSLLLANEGRF